MSLASSELLPQVVLLGGGCLFLLGGRLKRAKWVWGPLCLLAIAAAALLLAREVAQPVAAGGTGRDAMSFGFECLCLCLGFLQALAMLDTQKESERAAEVFGLLLLCIAGAMLAAVAKDLIVLALALELVAVPLAVLLLFGARDSQAGEAALKQFLLGALASLLLLYGFALLYGLTGNTQLAAIQKVFAETYVASSSKDPVGSASPLGSVAMVLIFAGLGFRLGLVPFQFGSPEVYQGATLWNIGIVSLAGKAAAFIALVRLLPATMPGFEKSGVLIAMVLAMLTMSAGALLAFAQSGIRRILAYTAMAHAGFAVAGIAVAFWESANYPFSLAAGDSLPGGLVAAILSFGVFLLSTAGLVAVLIYLNRRDRQVEHVDELAGLIRAEPVAAVCALVFLLTLTGVPPLPGFWARFFLLAAVFSPQGGAAGAVEGPHAAFVMLGIVAIISMLVLAAVYFRLVAIVFLERQAASPRPAGGQPALAAGVLAASMTVGIGLLPGPLLGFLERMEPAAAPPASSADNNDDSPDVVLQRFHL